MFPNISVQHVVVHLEKVLDIADNLQSAPNLASGTWSDLILIVSHTRT